MATAAPFPMSAPQGIGASMSSLLPKKKPVTGVGGTGGAAGFASGLRKQQLTGGAGDTGEPKALLGGTTFRLLQPPKPATPLLPPPALGPDMNADPSAAASQYANDQLGGTEFRINRNHPSRDRKAVAGPYAGKTANQARMSVEDQFRGLDPAAKQAAFDRSQSLQFRPGASAPTPAGPLPMGPTTGVIPVSSSVQPAQPPLVSGTPPPAGPLPQVPAPSSGLPGASSLPGADSLLPPAAATTPSAAAIGQQSSAMQAAGLPGLPQKSPNIRKKPPYGQNLAPSA